MLISNKGFSLVEMLVALVAGLLVAAAVTALYAAVIRANSTSVQLSMLNQDLQATLTIVAKDIQRAGFKADAAQILARNSDGDPIDASGNVVALDRSAMFSAFTLDASGAMTTTLQDLQRLTVSAPLFDCVLISYDANKDGVIAGIDEIMGYRYNQSQQEVEFNHSWSTAAQQSCTATTGWSALAGGISSTQITGLSFLLEPASGATDTGQRTLVLTITGRHKQNSQLQLELQRRVRLRNDQF